MSGYDLSSRQITAALAHLGSLLPATPKAEMVLIGGAAGVLSGALPASRTTVDCDVLHVSPPEVFDLCRYHADEVARRFQIAPQWLDASAHALAHLMLPGWWDRLVAVGTFGPLQVLAVGRLDLIALKAIAGRAEDLEDLHSLAVTNAEVDQLLRLFPSIRAHGISPHAYASALDILHVMRRRNDS